MTSSENQLALSTGLTAKTNQLCLGLESGAADILELVTPTTAELLLWWFGEDMVLARTGLNFHAGQKQAILNAIVAHEVLGKDQDNWTLLDLYKACAPDALLTGTRLFDVAQAKHAHPKYCFKMAGTTSDDMDDTSSTGDVMAAELRTDYAAFDFGIPFILQEADEVRDHHALDLAALPAFTAMAVAQLTALLGQGDTFISQDLQSATLFGDYRVDGAVMNVGGYNEYLSRLTRRISQALSEPVPKGNKVASHLAKPYLQVNTAELTGWLDDYIWTHLFDATFNPLHNENWRVLLLQPVVDHITKVFALALLESEQNHATGQTEVCLRRLSEVPRLMMRESHSVEVSKCIYTRLAWPARNGGLERTFIHWAQADTQVQAFCKISENRHTFARLRYVKDDGLPAFYSPDFLVRTAEAVYLVETKAQQQTIHPNVQRKRKGARLAELLDYARLRPLRSALPVRKPVWNRVSEMNEIRPPLRACVWMHALALQKPALLFHACSALAMRFRLGSVDEAWG